MPEGEVKNMKQKQSIRDMAYIALMAAVMAVCAWISVPVGDVPFTLQTLGVFCAVGLLGGKRGTITVLLYLLMGAVGLPVFSGFTGGPGRLLGVTGGYLIGFLFTGLTYWLVTALAGGKMWNMALGMVLGCVVYYAFGTAWFMAVYARGSGPIGFGAAVMKCVAPYVVPDMVKIALALTLSRSVGRYLILISD